MKVLMIFNEYDCILSAVAINETIPAYTSGVILLVVSNNPPAYAVEFFDERKNSLGWFTVEEKLLQAVN
jgi:hypothetical protein